MQTNLSELSAQIRNQESIVERIVALMRRMILSGELAAGQRIVESRWAKQLGVGQPTVREALVALEHQGLILRRSNQGAEVVSLSRDEILQALRVREELEILAVVLATEHAREEDFQRMRKLCTAMEAAARVKDAAEFFERDREWHATLWSATGNVFLPKLLEQLMLPLLAFLFLRNVRHYCEIDLRISAAAHLEMVEAMALRDGAKAREVALRNFARFASEHLEALAVGAD